MKHIIAVHKMKALCIWKKKDKIQTNLTVTKKKNSFNINKIQSSTLF